MDDKGVIGELRGLWAAARESLETTKDTDGVEVDVGRQGRGHVSEGAGANMNDMTSAVLCDKGVVGGYRRGVVVGKSCVSEIGSRCGRVSESYSRAGTSTRIWRLPSGKPP